MTKTRCERNTAPCFLEGKDFKARLFLDKQNKRIKLIKCAGDKKKAADEIIALSRVNELGKIISVLPEDDAKDFLKRGFVIEGKIGGYFKGKDGLCISYFTDKKRAKSTRIKEEDKILKISSEYNGEYVYINNEMYRIRTAAKDDAERISDLFGKVFISYPTPMEKPEYIREIIDQKVLFKVAEQNEKIISAASADMNYELFNAEMTDCATLPEHRGKGLLSNLIFHLEKELIKKGFISLFSLSRALSTGINIVFSKHGYEYSGRQIKNCDIMGSFEDMNIWSKKLI